MEERYEIRGKLGQGGLGAVYRAWDKLLKREVAIKRIVSGDTGEVKEEATRQMEKETGALAALQHPHIVTIFDVGSDEDGPFVVMELLTGQTLEDIVEKAPLTWSDFKELAVQIQEALVAAQDLGLIHRDLKPSNIMLNWLPSGRFQAKIVDFGLAKFSPKPSQQTVDHHDSIFGSIFYMAPEQFERTVLDARADMYSIGCVYYFTLTGRSPFEGDTGPQVMGAHLEHRVIPLSTVRPDIPKWAADWVMWHINRYPAERPENGRESLRTFVQLDVPMSQSLVPPPQPSAPVQPTVRIRPGGPRPSRPDLVRTQQQTVQVQLPPDPQIELPPLTPPKPLAPPAGALPSLHVTSPHGLTEPVTAETAPPPAAAVEVPIIQLNAAPVQPQQQAYTENYSQGGYVQGPGVAGPRVAVPQQRGMPPIHLYPVKKKGMTTGQKNALTALIGILILAAAYFVMQYLQHKPQ